MKEIETGEMVSRRQALSTTRSNAASWATRSAEAAAARVTQLGAKETVLRRSLRDRRQMGSPARAGARQHVEHVLLLQICRLGQREPLTECSDHRAHHLHKT